MTRRTTAPLPFLLVCLALISGIFGDEPSQAPTSSTPSPTNSPIVVNNDNVIADGGNAEQNNNDDDNDAPSAIITTEEGEETLVEHIQSDPDDVTGGSVWSSIGMIAVVICGCICFERLYSSCKKVYQKRTGRYGFSRLHNQTFNEFEDEDTDEDEDDEERRPRTELTTKRTRASDQESV